MAKIFSLKSFPYQCMGIIYTSKISSLDLGDSNYLGNKDTHTEKLIYTHPIALEEGFITHIMHQRHK